MNLDAQSPPRPMRSAATAGLAMVRRSSLGVLVILVVEFGFGMYVNLYLTVPRADHGRSLGTAIAKGPAMLSVHAVTGLLLGLGAVAVLVQAIRARHLAIIVSSAAGLFALAAASVTGTSFTSSGHPAESMGMAVLTGVALLCYAANLYLLRPPRRRG